MIGGIEELVHVKRQLRPRPTQRRRGEILTHQFNEFSQRERLFACQVVGLALDARYRPAERQAFDDVLDVARVPIVVARANETKFPPEESLEQSEPPEMAVAEHAR